MKETPNKNNPQADIDFIVEELFDLFSSPEHGKIELESYVGSTFHARVNNAARYLALDMALKSVERDCG